MKKILQTRERLLDQLKQSQEVGDVDTAAVLEYGIAEFDGVIALLSSLAKRTQLVAH
jgi:hypothetical protein